MQAPPILRQVAPAQIGHSSSKQRPACCPSRPLDTPLALMQAMPWPTAGCSDCQHHAVVIRPGT
eukprot:8378609-Heterocapsa_arctica.AAC.1